MIHSDWGDWLPNEVAAADPEGVDIWYLGCNGFILKGNEGTTIFIDPYLGTGDPGRTTRMVPVPFDPEDVQEADALLCTHEHTDHVHGESQAPILANTGATMYAPDDSLAVAQEEGWTDEWDVSESQFHEVAEGDTITVGEFDITVEVAHDPDSTHPVSYVISHDAGTFFHGGDSKPDEKFERVGEQYDIDLGVLAFGSDGMIPDKQTRKPTHKKWYSDENEIVEAARALQLDRLLPSHWDMWKGLTADPTTLHPHIRSFEYPKRLELVEIGDCVSL
ncbi:MBL fold metallo-hydrolase [Haladaptatus sp. DYSN1]|uniref:MBL fold metallo-hydrolase n=1 Tax=unclassified Haladaptatus TaxID=2622732 RepID=UPI002407043B|nr:MBL fold metallo-hydrolase [Haladaptatus sp. DYSN1]